MKFIESNKGLLQALLATLATVFVSYFVINLPEDAGHEDTGLWFVKFLVIFPMVFMTGIGWSVAFPEKQEKEY